MLCFDLKRTKIERDNYWQILSFVLCICVSFLVIIPMLSFDL